MSDNQLLLEGHRLARPCIHLVDQPADTAVIMAVWGGSGPNNDLPDGSEHLFTVDCRYLPPKLTAITGYISLYQRSDEDDCLSYFVRHDSADTPIDLRNLGGTPLYGRAAMSLPPVEGIVQFASPAVASWLVDLGWAPEHGVDSNYFPPGVWDKEYLRVWMDNCPLYHHGIYAMLGGWHYPWPDGDWEELLPKKLVAWTFEGAEPWIEIWADPDGTLQLLERIT